MFVLKKDHSFTWPVHVGIPVDDGKYDVKTFSVKFEAIDQDRITDLLTGSDGDLLKEVVTGWSDYAGIQGNEIPFSDEERDKLLKIPYVRAAMVKAFFEAINGVKGVSL